MKKCSIEACLREVFAKGFCRNHYDKDRVSRAGKCMVGSCSFHAFCGGLCKTHYVRLKKYGSLRKRKRRLPPGNKNKGPAHNRYKHGMTNTSIYKSWSGMKARCFKKDSDDYRNYGSRGITVCERWLTFENFMTDMHPKPKGLTLERKNNDGDYEPSNCVWADRTAQTRNRRYTKLTMRKADAIRMERKAGATLMSLSIKYGIGSSHVLRISNNEAWKIGT